MYTVRRKIRCNFNPNPNVIQYISFPKPLRMGVNQGTMSAREAVHKGATIAGKLLILHDL